MEFDELQRIWNTQTREPQWVINETALHNRIVAKKKQTGHITNISEWLILGVNLGAGVFILGLTMVKPTAGALWLYLMATWMLGTAAIVLANRLRRLKNTPSFDRSMLGEIRAAVSVATYQVRLSQWMRWNSLPIGLLSLLGVWKGEQSIWLILAIGLFFTLTYLASGWEHGVYKARKRELERLRYKLEQPV